MPVNKGFLNAMHSSGGVAFVQEIATTTGGSFFPGDLLRLDAGGFAARPTASPVTDVIVGVAAGRAVFGQSEFSSSITNNAADARNVVRAYTDLANTVFLVTWAKGAAITQADIGTTRALSFAAGNATLQLSSDGISATAPGATHTSRAVILGIYDIGDPVLTPPLGSNTCKVFVKIIDIDATSAVA
jgi:hypothetical protein